MLLPLLVAALFAAPATPGKPVTPTLPPPPAHCEVCVQAFTNLEAGKPLCAAGDASCGQIANALKAAGLDGKAWSGAGCRKATAEGGLIVKPCPPPAVCAALPRSDGRPFCPPVPNFQHPKGGPTITQLAPVSTGKVVGEWVRFRWVDIIELKEVKPGVDQCMSFKDPRDCGAIAASACRSQGYVTGQLDKIKGELLLVCVR